MTAQELLRYAGEVDGAIVGDDQWTAEVIEAYCPRLKVISKYGTGIDSIDREAAEEMGVVVQNVPDAFTVPVAENTVAYMLEIARRVAYQTDRMRDGRWEKTKCFTLCGKSLGIIGLGRIGYRVREIAEALGMDVLWYDPANLWYPMSEVLACDFVSLHCDLNDTSRGLIGHKELAQMKPTAYLINTSRGPVVNEDALLDALLSGQIAGAALDVFEEEPLPGASPLRMLSNVLLTSHNANNDPIYWERCIDKTISNCMEIL
jgi:D-3-phosphoglycerate dehydrogenase